jgi:nucleoside-diphosphate-sugar epimerase
LVAAVTIAVTGGTGFVGSRFLELAVQSGQKVKALARRPQEPRDCVEWIEGSLEDPDSLRRLVSECSSVVHVAGVINARDAAGFRRGNVDGTLAMLAAATAGGITRFVHVSSLAAREPKLSLYGASKARAEELVERSGLDWVIVRPPAVYGPGDRETLELFKMARGGQVFMPPKGGRASYIHVDDLARLLLVLAADDAPAKVVFEPDDGRAHGWSHQEIGEALGRAVGMPARTLHVPRAVLSLAARADRLVRGGRARLTPDRAAYFSHADWVVDSARQPPPSLWRPEVETEDGLARTALWYRNKGWL